MSKKILITGGIGDFICIESFMTPEERNTIETIFYATRAHKIIREIIRSLKFPKLKNHHVIWDDFSRFFSFESKNHLRNMLLKANSPFNRTKETEKRVKVHDLLSQINDFSISVIFNQIEGKRRLYTNSTMLKTTLTPIKATLPNDFICIAPYSPNDRRIPRDFTEDDWTHVLRYLKNYKIHGVILNIGNDTIPKHDWIIDLSNQTNFLESVEILKKAKGYIGIDSSLSVLATKLFDSNNLLIKSKNQHLHRFKAIYYAPKKDFSFIVKDFSKLGIIKI